MTGPAVDVVIPLHNKGPYVEQAVRSALGQTYAVRAVIVADDASSDDGPERVRALARQDARVRLLERVSDVPQGAASARNRAVAVAEAELVAFLDADDYWDGDKLAAQGPLFADSSVGTVHCGERRVDADGVVLSTLYPPAPLSGRELFDAVRLGRYGVTGSASGVVTRRSLLAAAGPFPEGVAFGEDWDMWARLAGLADLVAVPRLLTNIRALPTPSRTIPAADRFIDWLRVFDRWQADERLMRMAVAEARGMVAGHQARMLGDPHRMLVDYPRRIAEAGGTLGRLLYGSRGAYWTTLATMGPWFVVRACRRVGQELGRMRPT
jgi:glycosyltransferase involved in cell wall biosynthesis